MKIEIEPARHQVPHCKDAMDGFASALDSGTTGFELHPEARTLAARAWVACEKRVAAAGGAVDVWLHIGWVARLFRGLTRENFPQA